MNRTMLLCTGMLIIPALLQAQVAPTQCLTRSEMRSGISYIMPMLMNAAKNACATALPKGSFLTDGSTDMIGKYQILADNNKATAISLISKFGSEMKLEGLDPKSETDMFAELLPIMIEEGVSKEIKPESCATMNDIVESLAPLPPENMTRLVESIAVEVIRSDDAKVAKSKSAKKTQKPPLLCAE